MSRDKLFFVYIITNKNNTVLYTGVTSELINRIYKHKNRMIKGFSRRYNLEKLLYFETFNDPESAIRREKQIKSGSRQKKIDLINKSNPNWDDLYNSL
jgi:putative endonuclease